jgi:hypothetical protein
MSAWRPARVWELAEQSKHANGSGKTLKAGAEANQTIDGKTDEKIHKDARIHLKTLMLQRLGKVPVKRKVVDSLSQDDGDQVFQPSAGSCAEDLLLIGQDSVPSAGVAAGFTREYPKRGQGSSYSSGRRV